jgi:hypothetical protein
MKSTTGEEATALSIAERVVSERNRMESGERWMLDGRRDCRKACKFVSNWVK